VDILADDSEAGQKHGIPWMARPTVWFATAYTIVIIFHEAAHAITAVALGYPATLFNFWVNYEFAQATASEQAVVGVAGPTASLVIGVVCWVVYQRIKKSVAGLPFLFLAVFGVTNFFGNLMSTAFVVDFSNAAVRLGVSQSARVATAVAGAVAVAGILFATGRELWHWTPRHAGRVGGLLGLVVVPALVGTAIVILVNQPTPMGPSFVTARAGEGALWLFAALGLLTTRQRRAADVRPLRLYWMDGALAIVVLLVVKAMARGIPLMPSDASPSP
jgi:hypothetical protein